MKTKLWYIKHPFQPCFFLVNHHTSKATTYLNIKIVLSVNFIHDYKAPDQIHPLPQLPISSLTKNQPIMNSTSVNNGALSALPSALLKFFLAESCTNTVRVYSGCASYGQQCWHANQTLIATLHKLISYAFFCFSAFSEGLSGFLLNSLSTGLFHFILSIHVLLIFIIVHFFLCEQAKLT